MRRSEPGDGPSWLHSMHSVAAVAELGSVGRCTPHE
jgi:hypothetical protein